MDMKLGTLREKGIIPYFVLGELKPPPHLF